MKKIYLFSAILCFVCTFPLNAQLKVASNGRVGIHLANGLTPLSYLAIDTVGITNAGLTVRRIGQQAGAHNYVIYSHSASTVTNSTEYAFFGLCRGISKNKIGVYGDALASSGTQGKSCGVYGIAAGSYYGLNYGVYGIIKESTSSNMNGAGVYGTNEVTLTPTFERLAGYFRGKTQVIGALYANSFNLNSDARLKINVTSVEKDAVQKIQALRPVHFYWNPEDVTVKNDSGTFQVSYFSKDTEFDRKHYGFIAQEVQKLFPELVYEDGAGYLSVNYVELIPLLIEAVQDLSAEVEELKAQGNPQQAPRRAPASGDSADHQAVLYQNNPNPFSIDTEIGYLLPTNTQSATLYVYNMNGTQVADYPIHSYGAGSVTITAGHLEAGMYLYSLIADGQIVDTKRMILTK